MPFVSLVYLIYVMFIYLFIYLFIYPFIYTCILLISSVGLFVCFVLFCF